MARVKRAVNAHKKRRTTLEAASGYRGQRSRLYRKAKDQLLSIQRRWDAVGKVPREQVKVIEDRLRKVETHVRKLDEDHWQKSNPEKQARSDGFASQLEEARPWKSRRPPVSAF